MPYSCVCLCTYLPLVARGINSFTYVRRANLLVCRRSRRRHRYYHIKAAFIWNKKETYLSNSTITIIINNIITVFMFL